MSWDADLVTELDGKEIMVSSSCDWNYTHNTNRMIAAVLEDQGKACDSSWWNDLRKEKGDAWFHQLDGLSGEEGTAFLKMVRDGLEADPKRFRAMNPDNGWGSYETLLPIISEMLVASREWPSAKWRVSG